jgi:hypothetical protein
MKNLIFLFLTTFIFIGCSPKDKPVEKKVSENPDTSGVLNTSKDDAPPSQVVIAYALKKDNQYTYRLTSISNSMQQVISDSTMTQNLKQTITYLFEFNIADVEQDGVMDIKVDLKSVKLDANANGQKVSYQSGSKLSAADKQKFIEYEAVVNNPFSVRVDSKGEILEIYKVDKIASKFLDLQGLKDSVNADQKKQFQANIAESALKPLLQQIFRYLPKNSVNKNDIWSNEYPSRLAVFDIQNIAKYKLLDFEKLNDDRLAVIDAGLEISSVGKEKVTERGVNYEFKKPEASGSGKIYFNLNKGCIEKSKTKTSLSMTVKMDMPKSPRGPMKATRKDYIENTNVLELL